ncbi:PTS galactitol transporter subunit IIB [Candidatus Bathyarchaeota archaeon]|nr:MAG: PTS galactitol transporter subunit IIB [Candidatus Bathyarchaeota archaeon]
MRKNILVACGTAIATATIVAGKLKDFLKNHNIDANVIQCRFTEIDYYVKTLGRVDLIVTTAGFPERRDIPIVNGVPFISGIGREALEKKILEILKSH